MLALTPDTEITLDHNEYNTLQGSIGTDTIIQEENAVEIAMDQRLDLINAFDKVADAYRKVDVAADAIRAELNLVGYVQSDAGGSGTGLFGANQAQLRSTENQYELSLQLKLPLDRLAEKNAYRRALISLSSQQRAHLDLTDNIASQVRNAHRTMLESKERYQNEEESCTIAEKRAQDSLLLIQYGRASTRDLLDSYDDLFDSNDAVSDSLMDYVSASMDFYRDTGIIKILPDYSWSSQVPSTIQNITVTKSE